MRRSMDLVDSYSVVITDRLRDCRDFYRRWFGFEVGFEANWFVLLQGGGSRPVTLAFMHTDHPSSPPAPAEYHGDGAFLTFQVADAEAEHHRLVEDGLTPDLALTDEPWGQRRFGVVDPAGMWIDVVEQIEPAAGWWNTYLETSAQ
ncbi:MAG TPA: VOC family protein [Solirubrobacterales bacterium]|nr:VOC family protein [Solirubrobacterales bacterium]